MVGVPRSQGCRNCRRRKKGCDVRRPTCGNCAKLKIECGYDNKPWTFVIKEVTPSGSSSLPTREVRAATRLLTPPPRIPRRISSFDRTAFEIETYGDFWDRYAPRDEYGTVYIGGIRAAAWTKVFIDLAEIDRTVQTSLRACALVIRARVESNPSLFREATFQYTEALRRINEALQRPESAQTDATLATCRILALYEHFRQGDGEGISSQGADWSNHVEGTCRIVELRGPSKHVADHGHTLFEDCRANAVLAALIKRKPNFFTSMEWHTIPWESSPRNLRDQLFDIMITLPDLLERQDRLMVKLQSIVDTGHRFEILIEGHDYITRCIKVGKAFSTWESGAVSECTSRCPDLYQHHIGHLTLVEVCKHHGYGLFHMSMQYWAACVLAYASTWVAYRSINAAIRPEQSVPVPTWLHLPDVPFWMSPGPMAGNIAKNVSHYFTKQAGYWGGQTASWPMGVALHYYAATGGMESDEMELLRAIFRQPEHGRIANQFLRSIANSVDRNNGDCKDREQHAAMASEYYGTRKPR